MKKILPNKITLFWGQSGVGKSTLLNLLFPQLNLKVGDISESTRKGVHTTVTSIMIPVNENTFVIDMPGVREIDPYGIKKAARAALSCACRVFSSPSRKDDESKPGIVLWLSNIIQYHNIRFIKPS